MQYIIEKFLSVGTFFRIFLYFWFLICEHLRDALDFRCMLNANIKYNYLQKIEVILII